MSVSELAETGDGEDYIGWTEAEWGMFLRLHVKYELQSNRNGQENREYCEDESESGGGLQGAWEYEVNSPAVEIPSSAKANVKSIIRNTAEFHVDLNDAGSLSNGAGEVWAIRSDDERQI